MTLLWFKLKNEKGWQLAESLFVIWSSEDGAVSSSESLGGDSGGIFPSFEAKNDPLYLQLSGRRILSKLIDGEKQGGV